VRSVYRIDVTAGKAPTMSAFEERVVLVEASSLDEALERGEAEARAYALADSWPNESGGVVTSRYLGACDAFSMTAPPTDLAEVYSKLLYVAPSTFNAAILDRVLGTEAEQEPEDPAAFEPDFERVVPKD
jgi:hypothetical protein